MDGGFFDADLGVYPRTELDRQFWSSGVEFHLNTTAAYHLPLSMTLGLYYGFDEEAGGGFTFITFGYSGHGRGSAWGFASPL